MGLHGLLQGQPYFYFSDLNMAELWNSEIAVVTDVDL
jgi:hypothetical protein